MRVTSGVGSHRPAYEAGVVPGTRSRLAERPTAELVRRVGAAHRDRTKEVQVDSSSSSGPPRRRVSALDVAGRAGVSRSAVSMVLNGRADGNVSPAAQERIRRAAAELRYMPQGLGQSLRSRTTRTVGIITDEIVTSPFAGGLISGVGEVARRQGFMTVVNDTEGDRERLHEACELFFARSVDALVLATGGLVQMEPPESVSAFPTVLANCFDPAGQLPSVIPDEVGGSVQAVEHLVGLGHRDIVLLSGTEESPAVPLRREGFLQAARDVGVAARTYLCGWEIHDGYRAAADLFDSGEQPSAVIASNDRTAVGVLLAAAHRGLRVPEDISVVGVDDQPHVASTVVPALTTVALPHREIGLRAMEILLELVAGGAAPASVERLPSTLIERASSGSAATR